MAVQILSRRSSILYDRPNPIRLGAAELAVNNNAGEPGLFFADNASPTAGLIKVGPITIASSPPNTSAVGYTPLSKGESWLDTTSTHILKFYDGSAWQTARAVASVSTGYPSNPVDGQIHLNKSTNKLAVYDLAATSWIVVGP